MDCPTVVNIPTDRSGSGALRQSDRADRLALRDSAGGALRKLAANIIAVKSGARGRTLGVRTTMPLAYFRGGYHANWIYRLGQYGRPDGAQHDQKGPYAGRQRRAARDGRPASEGRRAMGRHASRRRRAIRAGRHVIARTEG